MNTIQRFASRIVSEPALIIGLTVLAAVLRFPGLGTFPPGLYRDEAYNGLDALRVLAGARPVFFEANNGREPLFIYLVALSISWLGQTPLAIRTVSAVLGTVTVPATYLMARAWFDRRTALLAALIAAVTVWPINLSRIGFRAVTMPLFVALALWQFGLASSTRRMRHFVMAGALFGLLFYTYLAARFAPLAVGAFIAIMCLTRRPVPWRGLAVLILVALLVSAPLLMYGVTNAGEFLARSFQVSILNPAINHGDPLGTLLRHAWRTLLMFTTRGDFIPRHNVPFRPVFDPLLGLAFILGLGVGLARWREPGHALGLSWTLVMLLPTVLAEDAPHFLRAVGVLPVVFVIPAWGLLWAWQQATRLRPALARTVWAFPVALGLVIGLSLTSTVVDYFWRHTRSQAAYYEFETGAVELANRVNGFLKDRAAGRVYLASQLWDNWPNVRFLVPESSRLTIIDPVRPPAGPDRADTLLVLWPYNGARAVRSLLPRDAEIRSTIGAMERGDLEAEAKPLFVTYQATPGTRSPGTLDVNFGGLVTLADYQVEASGRELNVRLTWDVDKALDQDYTVFVHVLGPAGMIAQGDGRPAQGLYPTTAWRPGDRVIDEHSITLPMPFDPATQSIAVGLYRLESGQRLPVLAANGEVVADHAELKDLRR